MAGNRKPQTFRDCANPACGRRFGPLPRLSQRFCSSECGYAARRRPWRRQRPTKAARRAHSYVAYLIRSGKATRPGTCEECGQACKPEAAHFNYEEPARFRWLCTRCHRAWDRAEPKGGVVSA